MPAPEPLTITDAAPLLRRGDLTPSELLEQCLARIDVYEPAVKAWAYLDRERARRDAEKLTAELKSGQDRGPLHGIPVGVKDIIDVFDMPTGCGSKLWANSYARRDATCVERLRQAGAVILGKTVTTPFAYLDPPPTRNPWNLDRTPGGSSSGSAAAVACGMCLAALGTQTGGSLIRPASYCGVCCIKPSYRRVSVEGVLPLAPSLDHIGVMANSVRDLATVYECIAGPGKRDPWDPERMVHDTFGARFPAEPDSGVMTLDRTDDYFSRHTEQPMALALVEFYNRLAAESATANYTATVNPYRLPPSLSEVAQHHLAVMAAEAAVVHAERLERYPNDYPPRITELIRLGLSLSASDCARAMSSRDELTGSLRYRFRFLILPATTGPAPSAATTGNPVMNAPWSFVGLPVVSIPITRTADGLPLAVQIVSNAGWDDQLLQIADWCEQVAAYPRTLPPVP